MDRFIDYDEFGNYVSFENLKSNMDRFIVSRPILKEWFTYI